MSNSVEYIIKLKDLASKVLGDLNKKANETESRFNKLSNATKGISGGLGNATVSVGNLAKGFIALQAVQKGWEIFRKDIVGAAMDMEQTRISFEVMIGDAKKAGDLIADLQRFGALTPFETKDLNENAKLLMNFGIESEKVIPILGMLGDVSGGNKEKLDGLSLAFAQVQSTGRLMGQDLLQMINAGFNPLKIMSEKTGKSMGELKKMMEDGAISADMVTQAFIDVTSEGGQFHNMMQKQSETSQGKWSTLVDKISLMGVKIGEKVLPVFNKLMDAVSVAFDWIELNFGKIVEIFQPIMDAMQPILDAFDFLIQKIGIAGESGDMLGKIFNFIGGVFKILGPLLKITGNIMGWMIKLTATLVSWIIEAVKWIAKLFGYSDKKFEEVKAVDNTAFAKELEEKKLSLLATPDGQAKKNPYENITSSIKGTEKNKSSATASRATQINITIDSLIKGGVTVATTNLTEGVSKIREMIAEELMKAVNDSQRIAGI